MTAKTVKIPLIRRESYLIIWHGFAAGHNKRGFMIQSQPVSLWAGRSVLWKKQKRLQITALPLWASAKIKSWCFSAEDDEQPAQQTASVLTLTDNTPAVAVANLQYYSYSYGSTTGGSTTIPWRKAIIIVPGVMGTELKLTTSQNGLPAGNTGMATYSRK